MDTEHCATVHGTLRLASAALTQHGFENPVLTAEHLLCFVLSVRRTHLYVNQNRPLHCDEIASFQKALDQRLQHVPIQYITGSTQFHSFELDVDRSVFIPRPETEILVDEALRRMQRLGLDAECCQLVDLCTGSGNIAIACALAFPAATVHATDLSAQALALARKNARRNNCAERIFFSQGDLFEPIAALGPKKSVSAIISNPPYILRSEIDTLSPEVRDFEPRVALDGGDDGLDIIRRIVKDAPSFLKDRGLLALEVGLNQAEAVKMLLTDEHRYEDIEITKDLSGIDRVVTAVLKGTQADL